MHVWKENRGWRISIITRVMPLCNSYNKMFVLWLIIHTLWNQLLLELSLDLFNTLQICYRHIEDVHEEVWCWKNIFWQTYRVFILAIFSTLWRYIVDILKMCMNKFDAEKKFFLTNLQGFYLSHFFNTLKICCRHTEDVHEEIWCRKNIFWQTVCRGVSSKSYLLPSFISHYIVKRAF